MATIVVRKIASTPVRTASQTWEKIIALLAPDDKSPARAELMAASGIGASVIASEATAADAIVVHGDGPRIRIYCLFGDDAIVGDGVNEDSLVSVPTVGEWEMSIPCPTEDLDWVQKKLKSCSSRMTARAVGSDVLDQTKNLSAKSVETAVDLEEFFKL